MLMVCVFALLLTFVSATKKSCSEADTTLLKYIEWQMKISKCIKNNKPGNCVCKQKEKRPIAFFARLDKTVKNLPRNAVLVFKTIITNEGDAYSSDTGQFTCPEDGVYSFTWIILSELGYRFHSVLVVDNTVIAYNHNDADKVSNAKAASHSAVVKLKKGNKVWIRAYNTDGKYANATWSSFSGFRL